MDHKNRALAIVQALKEEYPEAACTLEYQKPYELLFATRLAAQCTDARVNIVTKKLYAKYPTLESIAEASLPELEEIIRPCGLFHTKAKDIIAAASVLIERFGGRVPDSMDELLTLPGIGRKTASIILGDVYRKPAIPADTHCIRLSNRLGLCATKDPEKVEAALKKLIPPAEQSDFCHRLVLHGRAVCDARAPRCEACCLRALCPYSKA